jgi:hypothetical protein
MVSGISVVVVQQVRVDSDNIAVAAILGTRVVVEAKSDGGADGAVLIDPVGAFILGFGRGFLVTTLVLRVPSPFDVDATALSVMSGCSYEMIRLWWICGLPWCKRSRDVASRDWGQDGSREWAF